MCIYTDKKQKFKSNKIVLNGVHVSTERPKILIAMLLFVLVFFALDSLSQCTYRTVFVLFSKNCFS